MRSRLPPTTHHSLPTAYCIQTTVYRLRLLTADHCLPPTTLHPPHTIYCLQPITCYQPPTTYHVLPATYLSTATTYHLPPTPHPRPLNFHHSQDKKVWVTRGTLHFKFIFWSSLNLTKKVHAIFSFLLLPIVPTFHCSSCMWLSGRPQVCHVVRMLIGRSKAAIFFRCFPACFNWCVDIKWQLTHNSSVSYVIICILSWMPHFQNTRTNSYKPLLSKKLSHWNCLLSRTYYLDHKILNALPYFVL